MSATGIGASIPRKEDARLLAGRGRGAARAASDGVGERGCGVSWTGYGRDVPGYGVDETGGV